MTCFIRILTAFAIVVHATVGCCAHGTHTSAMAEAHATAQAACVHVDGSAVAHHHGGDCAGHADHRLATPESLETSCVCNQQSPPPVPHGCCHATCKWPARELRESVDLLILSLSIELESDVNTARPLVLVTFGSSLRPFSDSVPRTLPVRSHLAKCVFLI